LAVADCASFAANVIAPARVRYSWLPLGRSHPARRLRLVLFMSAFHQDTSFA
jgi:hypothetical protein